MRSPEKSARSSTGLASASAKTNIASASESLADPGWLTGLFGDDTEPCSPPESPAVKLQIWFANASPCSEDSGSWLEPPTILNFRKRAGV